MKNLYSYLFLILANVCFINSHAAGSGAAGFGATIPGTACYGAIDYGQSESLNYWFTAAETGNLWVLLSLIGKIDINARDKRAGKFQKTALIIAAQSGYTRIVELLLQKPGIDVNIQDADNYTALMRAAAEGHESIVRLLLQKPGINVNAACFGVTALILAAHKRNEHIVKLLLEVPNIRVNSTNKCSKNALHWAVAWGEENMVRLLLRAPNIDLTLEDEWGQTSLMMAQERNRPWIVDLIKRGLVLQALEALADENLDKLKAIVNQIGADAIINLIGNYSVDRALAASKPTVIEFLLQNTDDSRKFLSRFPFYLVNPKSDLFKYFVDNNYITAEGKLKAPESALTPFAPKSDITKGTLIPEATQNGTEKKTEKLLKAKICAICSSDSAKASTDGHNCKSKQPVQAKTCAVCSKEAAKRCSGCKTVYYCSSKCQTTHWIDHKKTCCKN